jgi:cytochrome c oxidase subunit II
MNKFELGAILVVSLMVAAALIANAGGFIPGVANPAANASGNASQAAAGGDVQVFKLKMEYGVYSPHEIRVKEGQKVRIEFDQNTFTGCMTTFNIYDLGIKAYIPTTPYVEFTATKAGSFRSGCNMGMGNGLFTVDSASGAAAPVQAAAASPSTQSAGGTCGGSGGGCGCGGSR